MDAYLKIFLVVAGGIAGIFLLNFCLILVRLLKNPFWPVRYQPIPELPTLSGAQRAAMAELEALGFRPCQSYAVFYGEYTSHAIALMLDDRVVALLDLRATLSTGYQCSFFSVTTEQQLLCTPDRMGNMALPFPSHVQLGNCNSASLTEQWAFHHQLIAGRSLLPIDVNSHVNSDIHNNEHNHEHNIETLVLAPLLSVFDFWVTTGILKKDANQYFIALPAACSLTMRVLKNQKKLMSPSSLLPSQSEHLPTLFADGFRIQEQFESNQVSRRGVQLQLLMITMLLSLVGWGLLFDWGMALVLVVVILLHELGHALVMRLFGYHDMNMFFVPFLGALVTGKVAPVSTFKQTLILLAGPVPGIFFGLVLLGSGLHLALPLDLTVRKIGELFVIINAFNLLPVPPLDGGKIIEMALFSRWPRLRFAFNALGLAAMFAAALWLREPLLFVLSFLLLYTIRSQWRIAQLMPHWRNDVSESEQVALLFDHSHRRFGTRPLMLHYREIKAVLQSQRIRPAGVVEAVFGVTVVVVFLAGTSVGLAKWNDAPRMRPLDPALSVEQKAFHHAKFAYDTALETYDEQADAGFEALKAATEVLAADDPRRVDFQMLVATSQAPAERHGALEKLLLEGKPGEQTAMEDIAREYLWNLQYDRTEMEPPQRQSLLAAGIKNVEKQLPDDYSLTISTRLALAEAIDDSGDSAQALTLLDTIYETAKVSEKCKCHLDDIVHAKVWYFLSHGKRTEARATLLGSEYADKIDEPNSLSSFAYAWLLLEEGRFQEASEQMVLSEKYDRKRSLLQKLEITKSPPIWYRNRLDVIYALIKNEQTLEAQALIKDNISVSIFCYSDDGDNTFNRSEEPWQKMRHAKIATVKDGICPYASPMRRSLGD